MTRRKTSGPSPEQKRLYGIISLVLCGRGLDIGPLYGDIICAVDLFDIMRMDKKALTSDEKQALM